MNEPTGTFEVGVTESSYVDRVPSFLGSKLKVDAIPGGYGSYENFSEVSVGSVESTYLLSYIV
jgi:hypothetical protein